MSSSTAYYCPECEREFEGVSDLGDELRCPVDGDELFQLPEGLSPGVVIDGRYTIVKPLGKGGMGVVFAAKHQATGEDLAVKLISAVGEDEMAVRRFFREAKASQRIVHPGVIEVYDFGQTSDGRPFMVMEILEGEPLDELLARQGVLAPRRALNIAAQIASALAASHAHQILHRDLKPANVMIRREDGVERVKVLDFGLAKAVEDDTGELGTVTATGMLVGTPQYMSPEQFQCADLGPPTDFYSLGVMLYEMLTGRVPFDGQNIYALMQAHVLEDPVAPGDVAPNADFSPEVEELCMQLLEKEEEARPTDAESLMERFRELAGGGDGAVGDLDADQMLPPESVEFTRETVTAAGADLTTTQTVQSAEIERFRPGLVGRDRTRKVLDGIWERAVSSAEPAVVVLQGPGGVGKSKLLEWYRSLAEQSGCRVVRGVHSEGHLGPQAAVKGVVEELLDVQGQDWEAIEARLDEMTGGDGGGDEDDGGRRSLTAGQRQRLRRFLRPSVTETAEVGGDKDEERGILYETVLQVLRWAAGDEPTLAIMDDLRDDRPFDSEFVERLGAHMTEADQSLVVVMAVRTDDIDDGASADDPSMALSQAVASSLASSLRDGFHRIEVGPLQDEDIETLVRRAMPGIADEAARRVASLAGGNPLFTLQLLRNMVAEGSLRRDGRGWELVGEPTIPDDLTGVIDARLKRLRGRDGEEDLLVRAALIGQRIPLELLDELLELEGNFDLLDEMDELLDRLVDDGWLRDAESWDEEAVFFEHGFVHEALRERYGSKRAARKIHANLAEALEFYYADELEPQASRIADHFLASRNHGRALPYLIKAARAAEARYAMDDAVDGWRRAEGSLRRARADEETKQRVRRGLARVLIYVGEYDAAGSVLDELDDDGKTMELRGDLADARAEFDEALTCYEAAIEEAKNGEDAAWESQLRYKLSLIFEKRSDYERATAEAEAALELGEKLESEALRGNALNKLAMITQLSGSLDESLQYLDAEEIVWREQGDDVALGRCLYTRGSLHWRRSEPKKALAAYGSAVPLLERCGHRRGLGHCLGMAGAVAEKLDRLDEALAYCQRAHEVFSQIGDHRGLQGVALCFADVHSARGEHDRAIEWARRALEGAEAISEVVKKIASLVTLGSAYLRSGAPERAIEYFEEGLALEKKTQHIRYGRAHIHDNLGDAFMEIGDDDRAREHLERAVAIYEEIGNIEAARAAKLKLDD